jgi:hypothetical protein
MFRRRPFRLTLRRFLDDTTAMILVGEIANVDNILAFFVWYAENGKKTQFYKGKSTI